LKLRPARCLTGLLTAVALLCAPADAALLSGAVAAIPEAVEDAIRSGETPGAVVLLVQDGEIVLRRAFGQRRPGPHPDPMTIDTVFDLASLTKPVATATAVMQLVESGRVGLDDPAGRYWKEFAAGGKERITIRQLLTHYSGLRPGLPPKPAWSGYRGGIERIVRDSPRQPPGSVFTYSDLNFVVLAEVVRRVAGEPIDVYARRHIFEPLGMRDTGFAPGPALFDRLAPTMEGSRGAPHDPNTRRMGGVSGAAGLFATADDLGRFAQALLDGGGRVLAPATVQAMTAPQSPAGRLPERGLGWALSSPAGNWSGMLPPGSYGHKGYTGTMLWVDPATRTYLVVLSSRVYPDGEPHGDALRDRVFGLAVAATGRPAPSAQPRPQPEPAFMSGIDVLAAERFTPLWGKCVGVITNHTGMDASGRRTIDLLHQAPGVKLAAVFTPEHGLTGKADAKVGNSRDAATGLPVHSLYGEGLRPKPETLKGLDALVFDVQDAGVRFYTYMSTMAYAMEAATGRGIEFYVLDRPNPITAAAVAGPVLDGNIRGFTAYFPMPVRHGMTLGELARMFNAENRIGARLTVVPMRGYCRDMWFDETGRPWVNPSPNLR
jgi:CubicO group peptidase (beta-lactamase class C family)